MVPFYYFHDFEFDWEESYWYLKFLSKKQLIKHPWPFDGEQKISVIFISNKSIIMKINEIWTIFFQKLLCSPSKIPTSTTIILRNTTKRSRMFYQLLLAQNVQISLFFSVKSIIMKIKERYHVSLTSNISAKTWSKSYLSRVLCWKTIPLHQENCRPNLSDSPQVSEFFGVLLSASQTPIYCHLWCWLSNKDDSSWQAAQPSLKK